MTRKGTIFGVIVLLAVASALVYAGWTIWTSSSSQVCRVCSRPIHEMTRSVGLLNGKREVFCCPTCALTEHHQSGEKVKLVEVSDFNTRTPLAPADAIFVAGSDLNCCVENHVLVGQHEQISPMEFDRCSPSIFAFAQRKEAETFQKQHGGTILSFEELLSAYQR
jgi:hypothetical protein